MQGSDRVGTGLQESDRVASGLVQGDRDLHVGSGGLRWYFRVDGACSPLKGIEASV